MIPYDTNFMCYDCGFIADTVVWPNDVEAIQALLNMRPGVHTRNWEVGETLNDLLIENIAHDIMPDEWRELAANPEPSQITVMRTVDERVVGGLLLADVIAARTELNRISWMNSQDEIESQHGMVNPPNGRC
jgi:hypothetical protein